MRTKNCLIKVSKGTGVGGTFTLTTVCEDMLGPYLNMMTSLTAEIYNCSLGVAIPADDERDD